jgi:hypothetical protein
MNSPEDAANELLIEKRAISVDFIGNRILDESALLAQERDTAYEKKIL